MHLTESPEFGASLQTRRHPLESCSDWTSGVFDGNAKITDIKRETDPIHKTTRYTYAPRGVIDIGPKPTATYSTTTTTPTVH